MTEEETDFNSHINTIITMANALTTLARKRMECYLDYKADDRTECLAAFDRTYDEARIALSKLCRDFEKFGLSEEPERAMIMKLAAIPLSMPHDVIQSIQAADALIKHLKTWLVEAE